MLDALDPEQRAVAQAVRGPVCVLAGAGTGKTRAITHRIAYAALTGVADPARVLALTFTVRAAGELRGRLRLLGGAGLGTEMVRATTFHAAALRQLTYFWPRVSCAAGCACSAARAWARRRYARRPSTPRRCVSSPTSGPGWSAGTRPACWNPSSR